MPLCHCPKVIIIHVGASDFSVGPAHQLCLNTQIAVSFNKQLFQACQKFKHFSIGIFYSLLLKEPWYAGWEPQQVACRARFHFNGCLAKYSTLHGSCIINHPTLTDQDESSYLEDGSLSLKGHMEFLKDCECELSKHDRHQAMSIGVSFGALGSG